jgi:hypothetical protein
MSVANYPFHNVQYNAVGSGIVTLAPPTAVNTGVGTYLPILRRLDGTEIVFSLPAGIYEMVAECTLHVADNETFAQQIDLQVVRVAGAGGLVQQILATQVFSLNRLGYAAAAVATFAAIVNVDFRLCCGRGSIEVVAGQFYTCRVLINGNPVGGSDFSQISFVANLTGDAANLSKITVV